MTCSSSAAASRARRRLLRGRRATIVSPSPCSTRRCCQRPRRARLSRRRTDRPAARDVPSCRAAAQAGGRTRSLQARTATADEERCAGATSSSRWRVPAGPIRACSARAGLKSLADGSSCATTSTAADCARNGALDEEERSRRLTFVFVGAGYAEWGSSELSDLAKTSTLATTRACAVGAAPPGCSSTGRRAPPRRRRRSATTAAASSASADGSHRRDDARLGLRRSGARRRNPHPRRASLVWTAGVTRPAPARVVASTRRAASRWTRSSACATMNTCGRSATALIPDAAQRCANRRPAQAPLPPGAAPRGRTAGTPSHAARMMGPAARRSAGAEGWRPGPAAARLPRLVRDTVVSPFSQLPLTSKSGSSSTGRWPSSPADIVELGQLGHPENLSGGGRPAARRRIFLREAAESCSAPLSQAWCFFQLGRRRAAEVVVLTSACDAGAAAGARLVRYPRSER